VKAIIDGKLYDTEKAEKIYSFRRKRNKESWALPKGLCFVVWHDITIYKTSKGSYFEHEKFEHQDIQITVTTEDAVKKVISDLNPDKFVELFGAVEEA
jgi:hypothetical protein